MTNIQSVSELDNEPQFVDISFVPTLPINSKWQATFCQVFPIGYDSLPDQHESDKEFFEANWKGEKMVHNVPMTFENFMFMNHPDKAPKLVVKKRSGYPFKSGLKIAQVKRAYLRTFPSAPKNGVRVPIIKMVYGFSTEEEGYFVDVHQCEPITG